MKEEQSTRKDEQRLKSKSNPPINKQNHKPSFYSLALWLFPLLVLLPALCIGTSNLKNHATINTTIKSLIFKFQLKSNGLFSQLKTTPEDIPKHVESFPYGLLWMAPFLSGGGYSSEAWSYVSSLVETKRVPKLSILQHGDMYNMEFWNGLPKTQQTLAMKLHGRGRGVALNQSVVVCHSEPGAWYPPLFDTLPCPPSGYEEPLFVIGRTMFETDRVNPEHVRRCNAMDSIWVPTEFHVRSFIQSGVVASKVVKMVQGVDVDFFDPDKWDGLPLRPDNCLICPRERGVRGDAFVFLSIFKWEWRKGWDVLLKAYLQEFSAEDNVVLYVLTNAFHSDKNYEERIMDYLKESQLQEPSQAWAVVHLSDEHVPQHDLPRLYKSATAFVLPSRGEGWGRPNVEAMAMALPIITTNWSGPTEYLTDNNGYPLRLSGMVEVKEGPFAGHLCAEPSVDHLRLLMRHVFSNPLEAKKKGIQARLDMIQHYSPSMVSMQVVKKLSEVAEGMSSLQQTMHSRSKS